jgi:hypothetical protein
MTASSPESLDTNDHPPSAVLTTPNGCPVIDTIAVPTMGSGFCDLRAGEHTGGVAGLAATSERADAAKPSRTAVATAVTAMKMRQHRAI